MLFDACVPQNHERLIDELVDYLWRSPRTWIAGEMVTDVIMNQHVRDQFSSLKSEHYATQMFRGLQLRTHPDFDKAAAQVWLDHADEIVLDDGTRVGPWDDLAANIAVSGAGGLDAGAELASTWYEIYAIRKSSDGTKNVLLHRAKDYFEDEDIATGMAANETLRFDAAKTKLAQGFQVDTAGKIEIVDVWLQRVGSPTGRLWLTVESDSGGDPSAVQATSDKVDVAAISTSVQRIRFVFRSPFTAAALTQYHIVFQGDYTISSTNYVNVLGTSTDTYATRGSFKKFDGSVWSASASVLDARVKAYVTRNDIAVTMPTPYDQKALVGYVFNNSGSNFGFFVARDRWVFPESNFDSGAITTSVYTLVEAISGLPPVPLVTEWKAFSTVADDNIRVQGVPDGYGNALVHYVSAVPAIANVDVYAGRIYTEFQGVYVSRNSGTGNCQARLRAWKW